MYFEKYFLISDYESMEVLGIHGLFTRSRVDKSTLPEGFFKYSLREGRDDPFASVKSDVLALHMGDFICKEELDLNGQDECDLYGDYSFTKEEVDLDEFFGEDIKYKIAQELEDFYFDFDTYDYQDNVPPYATREDVVLSINEELADKSSVEGIIHYFEKLLNDNEAEDFLEPANVQKVHSFICALAELNKHNHDKLDDVIEKANTIKENARQGGPNQQPEIQQ